MGQGCESAPALDADRRANLLMMFMFFDMDGAPIRRFYYF